MTSTVRGGIGIQAGNTTVAGSAQVHIGNVYGSPTGQSASPENKCKEAFLFHSPCNGKVKRQMIKTARGERAPNTCQWIETAIEFQQWSQAESPQLLWISGGPGKGKTYLSVYLAENLARLAQPQGIGVARPITVLEFYCDSTHPSRDTPAAILRGLLYQLVSQIPALWKHLERIFESMRDECFTSFDALWVALKGMLQDPDCIHDKLCVLDGLDECDHSIIGTISERLQALFSKSTNKLPQNRFKAIVLSRRNPRVLVTTFRDFPGVNLDSAHESYTDLATFVKFEVQKLSSSDKSTSSQWQEDLTRELMSKAEGTFLWVSIALSILKDKMKVEVYDTLENLKSLPKSLEGVYHRMVSNIEPCRREMSLKILQWITLAYRPLTLAELADALFIEPLANMSIAETVADYVSFCGDLVCIVDADPITYFQYRKGDGPFHSDEIENYRRTPHDNLDTINIVHQSLKDFLICGPRQEQVLNSPQWTEKFKITMTEGHSAISRRCVECFQSGPFSNGPLSFPWSSQYVDIHDIRVKERRESRQNMKWGIKTPILIYAVRYWPEHARNASEDAFCLDGEFYSESSTLRDAWYITYVIWCYIIHLCPCPPCSLVHIACRFGISPLITKLIRDHNAPATPSSLDATKRLLNSLDGNSEPPLYYVCDESIMHLMYAEGGRLNGRSALWLRGPSSKGIPKFTFRDAEFQELRFPDTFEPVLGCPEILEAVHHHSQDLALYLLKTVEYEYGQAELDRLLVDAISMLGRHDYKEDLVSVLLAKGADKDFVFNGWSMLEWAIFNEYKKNPRCDFPGHTRPPPKSVFQLLSHGANINPQGTLLGGPLKVAALMGNRDLVATFVERGIDITERGGFFGTALQAAAASEAVQSKVVVEYLIEIGAVVNDEISGVHGTPLQAAARRGEIYMLQFLLKQGALVNARGGYFGSALAAAAASQRHECIGVLLGAGASQIQDVIFAALRGRDVGLRELSPEWRDKNIEHLRQTLDYLLDQMPLMDADIFDIKGRTLLARVAKHGVSPVVERLLRSGASQYLKDQMGQPVYDRVEKKRNRILLAYKQAEYLVNSRCDSGSVMDVGVQIESDAFWKFSGSFE